MIRLRKMWKRFQHVPRTRYGRAYVTERSFNMFENEFNGIKER